MDRNSVSLLATLCLSASACATDYELDSAAINELPTEMSLARVHIEKIDVIYDGDSTGGAGEWNIDIRLGTRLLDTLSYEDLGRPRAGSSWTIDRTYELGTDFYGQRRITLALDGHEDDIYGGGEDFGKTYLPTLEQLGTTQEIVLKGQNFANSSKEFGTAFVTFLLEGELQLSSGEDSKMTLFLTNEGYDAHYENDGTDVHLTGDWSVNRDYIVLDDLMTCTQDILGTFYTDAMLCSFTNGRVFADDEVVLTYGTSPSWPR
jgi:hypothetical protein